MSMTNPITPPPELVQQWLCSDDYLWGPLEQKSVTITANRLQNIATQAARWGADQELEACCEHMRDHQWGFVERPDGTMIHRAVYLQQSRRPEPPSLKEQALEAQMRMWSGASNHDDWDLVRSALEQLPDAL